MALVRSTAPRGCQPCSPAVRVAGRVFFPAAAFSVLVILGLLGPAITLLPVAPAQVAAPNTGSSYVVTFYETGLAKNTTWSISINSVAFVTNTSRIKASVPVGTQDYIVSVPTNYSGPRYGNFTVVNSPLNVSLTYQYNCPVLIRETGLPVGALWWTNVTNSSGTQSYFTRGPTLNWTAFPGKYLYSVGTASAGYGPTNSSGQYLLSPTGYRGSVTFLRAQYRINFTTRGLPTGSAWVLNLTAPNGTVQQDTMTVPTLSLLGPAGTYLFIVSAAGYTASPSSGWVTAGPQNVSQTILFQPVRTPVAFAESGLAPGGRWWVNLTALNGSRVSGTSTGSWVNFSLPTGTYSFLVNAGGFAATPASGSFSLSSSGYGRTILFSATTPGRLYLRIRPSRADVTIGGRLVNLSANGTAAIPLGPGVYPVEAVAVGYAPYFTNVSVLSGAMQNLSIGMTSLPAPAASIPFNYVGPLGLLLIGVLLATAVALAVALVLAWRRRPPTPPAAEPPEQDVDEDLSETWLAETEDLPP